MVFVPAIMGAGVVFSAATLVSDVLSHGTRTVLNRRARIHGRMVAATVIEPERPALVEATHPAPLPVVALVGSVAAAFGMYVAVGATGNYLRDGGYTHRIAWIWALSLLVVTSAFVLAAACLTLASHGDDSPPWLWAPLVTSPLLGLESVSTAEVGRARRARWLVVLAATSTTLLAALATWPHVLMPFDRRAADLFDANKLSVLDVLGEAAGSTWLTLVVAFGLGVGTVRCRRLAWVFISSVVVSFALTALIRWFVRRPRPLEGPFPGSPDSFPSGHLVQITLLAALVPLAVYELTGSKVLRRWSSVALAVIVGLAAISRINSGFHFATDVIAGIAIGLTVGSWGRLALLVPESHRACRRCRTASVTDGDLREVRHSSGVGERRPGHRGVIDVPDRAARFLRAGAIVSCLGSVALLSALGAADGLPRNPDGDWLTPVEGPAQIALLVMVVVGALAAFRWPAVAAVVIALSGVGLAVLSSVAHPPAVAVGVAAAFLTPAVALWVAWQRHETPRRIAGLALVTSTLLAGSWLVADATHAHFFGPTHPESPTIGFDDPAIEWAWSGAATDDGFHVVAMSKDDDRAVELRVRGGGDTIDIGPSVVTGRVHRFEVDGLDPATEYRYEFTADAAPTGVWTGTVRTFADDGAGDVTIAVSSCARTGSNGAVFDAIRAIDPDLYVITGDAHYSNIDRDNVTAFDRAYAKFLTAPAQAALYRSVPIAYVWDDHDYSGNDGDSSAASRPAARASYERNVAHHQLVSDRTINQAFSVNGVRLILLDTRSARVPGETLLGAEQLVWFENELLASSPTHDLVVVVTPTPWIGAASGTADTWAGFADERHRISQFIAEHRLDDVTIVGGDAHMVAIDDGTNADYSGTDGGAETPVLQAAALDRPGSVKGGPYSEGTFPGGGQFGVITVRRSADGVEVTLEGRRYDGEQLVGYTFNVER
ncbi:MAG: alkaline phosphatase D family protein [Actinomycetota bacterium]